MDRRLGSMDLLRAVAILLVILAHTILSYGAPNYLAPLQLGGTGVNLFFLLSGWLLGNQLFKESIRHGGIDIKRFWIRRWMRTLPAYYAILVLSVTQRYMTQEDVSFPWQYFFFVQNYYYPLDFFSISWSLSVEEQFYLLVAPLIHFLTKKNKHVTTVSLIVLLLLPIFFRNLELYGHTNETHVSLDSCVAGVLLAQIYNQHHSLWLKFVKYAAPMALVTLFFYIFFYVARYFPEWSVGDPGLLLQALIFGSWVVLANSNHHWRHFLYIPGAYFVATRSYSLYLLHPEVLALLRRFSDQLPFIIYISLALIGSLILADISYRIIEKPFINAREKFDFSSR
jgi:peptidoglycan/LPS O-acetylase OafA/YrhL